MSATIKPLGLEQSVNATPIAFSNAACVRLVELNTGNALITRAYANGTVIATFTLRQGSEVSVMKNFTDTLASNSATVVGTAVGFTN
jgi:hypothetical protein